MGERKGKGGGKREGTIRETKGERKEGSKKKREREEDGERREGREKGRKGKREKG